MNLLPNTSLCAQHTVRPNKQKCWSSEQRRVYCRAMQGERVARAPKIPNSPKGFSKVFLNSRWRMGIVGCCELLGVNILCPCSCPCRSGHIVPVNLQDKCYSLFCFLSLYEGESIIPLKVRALRMGSIFQALGNILSFFLFFFFLAALRGMRDFSSPTRDRTRDPCSGSVEP